MTELVVVAFIAVLVFGATRIPALGDALGRALRNLRRASQEPPGEDRAGPPPGPRA